MGLAGYICEKILDNLDILQKKFPKDYEKFGHILVDLLRTRSVKFVVDKYYNGDNYLYYGNGRYENRGNSIFYAWGLEEEPQGKSNGLLRHLAILIDNELAKQIDPATGLPGNINSQAPRSSYSNVNPSVEFSEIKNEVFDKFAAFAPPVISLLERYLIPLQEEKQFLENENTELKNSNAELQAEVTRLKQELEDIIPADDQLKKIDLILKKLDAMNDSSESSND